MPKPSITKIHVKIRYLKFISNFPGANELINLYSAAPGQTQVLYGKQAIKVESNLVEYFLVSISLKWVNFNFNMDK